MPSLNRILSVFLVTITLLLAGCATSGGEATNKSGKPDLSQTLYLRGMFTWWDADDAYKVQRVGEDLYKATAKLEADGQPYEFKFADASWSPGTNCGFLNPEDKEVELGRKLMANCSSKFENFYFIPEETAEYEFYFDDSGETPVVYVQKAES
ncbi:MAG: hypothetical protein CME36_03815 [unclassified Hahellaceae]|nr:hypothetical protein [Hahellaceae bacterium]|tara:strand:- start:2758 stop:3216 length:459 start_codon:yes stop_codon:yes gene_type:complete